MEGRLGFCVPIVQRYCEYPRAGSMWRNQMTTRGCSPATLTPIYNLEGRPDNTYTMMDKVSYPETSGR